MTVTATDTQRLSNLVKYEVAPEMGYCRKALAFDNTNGDVAIGTLLGLNATGKWEVALQAPAVAYTQFALATDAGVKLGGVAATVGLFRGPASVSKAAIVWHASFDLAAEKNAAYAALEAQGVQVLDAV